MFWKICKHHEMKFVIRCRPVKWFVRKDWYGIRHTDYMGEEYFLVDIGTVTAGVAFPVFCGLRKPLGAYMENKEEFIAWIRGKRNVTVSQEGGYLIPQKIKRGKKGFIAWFWRLLKNERGFEYVNLQEEFIAKAHLTKRAPD